MLHWWDSMSLISKIYASAAIPATLIMIVQAILMLIGISDDVDGAEDLVGDVADGELSLISVRGIVAFFSIGGWAGIVADSNGLPTVISITIAVAVGLFALIVTGLLIKSAMRLQGSGNISIVNAIGKVGKAYIPIPPKGKGYGKINIYLQGRLVELEAINEGDKQIHTNENVVVCAVADDRTVIVKSTNEDANITNPPKQGGISKWNQ